MRKSKKFSIFDGHHLRTIPSPFVVISSPNFVYMLPFVFLGDYLMCVYSIIDIIITLSMFIISDYMDGIYLRLVSSRQQILRDFILCISYYQDSSSFLLLSAKTFFIDY